MQLGPYRLLSRIGQGGMGEVWKAEDTNLLRTVAVKLLREEMAGDTEWKARFLREARTAARLSHPNIATIYAIDEVDQRMYIAMELVEGESLKALIAARTLTMPDVVRIIKRCADALTEAHAHGVIHRDVKPENIVVTKRGENNYHGSVFEYFRNDALDAANFFDNIIGKKSPLRMNQCGGSIGGPIEQNKAFFFFSWGGQQINFNQPIEVTIKSTKVKSAGEGRWDVTGDLSVHGATARAHAASGAR